MKVLPHQLVVIANLDSCLDSGADQIFIAPDKMAFPSFMKNPGFGYLCPSLAQWCMKEGQQGECVEWTFWDTEISPVSVCLISYEAVRFTTWAKWHDFFFFFSLIISDNHLLSEVCMMHCMVTFFVLCGHDDMAVTEFYCNFSVRTTACSKLSQLFTHATGAALATLAPLCLSIHAESMSTITCGFMSHRFGKLHGIAHVIM